MTIPYGNNYPKADSAFGLSIGNEKTNFLECPNKFRQIMKQDFLIKQILDRINQGDRSFKDTVKLLKSHNMDINHYEGILLHGAVAAGNLAFLEYALQQEGTLSNIISQTTGKSLLETAETLTLVSSCYDEKEMKNRIAIENRIRKHLKRTTAQQNQEEQKNSPPIQGFSCGVSYFRAIAKRAYSSFQLLKSKGFIAVRS